MSNEETSMTDRPMTNTVAVSYRFRPFYDLVADAIFQHKQAVAATQPYVVNRFSRAAIVSAALCVESLTNCLIADLELEGEEFAQVDSRPPLEKFAHYFKAKRLPGFSKGDKPVQRCAELIKIRNSYVHPKTLSYPAEMAEVADIGDEWLLPFSVELNLWPLSRIPMAPFAWNGHASAAALRICFAFFDYVVKHLAIRQTDELAYLLGTLILFPAKGGIMLPLHEEMRAEFLEGKKFGLKVQHFGIEGETA